MYILIMQRIKQRRLHMGLKSLELAERLGVSAARVSVLERDENRGAVTLAMLQRAAEALDCRLEYRLVPNTGSEQTAAKPRVRLQPDASGKALKIPGE